MFGCEVDMDLALIQELLDGGKTYAQISYELKRRAPGSHKGLSECSVRRYVANNGMRAVSKQHKEKALERGISEVSMCILAVHMC